MSRRNVILMLVEGTSDETLLVPAFTSLLAPMIAEGKPFRCDVTTLPLFPAECPERRAARHTGST